MRIKIVLGLLLVLFAATVGLMVSHGTVAHTAPRAPSSAVSGPTPAGSGAASVGSAPAAVDGGHPKLMDRPLRVAILGWDLGAAGVLANGGLGPSESSDFARAGVVTSLLPVTSMSAVEGALARGGVDEKGADIAVVPFADFVASFERVRALSPEVFFVVGWSRGREALVSTKETLPSPIDTKPGDKPSVAMVGTVGDATTFLGLFALDQNGFPLSAIRLVAPGGRSDDPPLAAVDRDAPAESGRHNILLTTADASRLMPFVAVGPHGLLDKQADAVAAWVRAWLEAQKRLDDAPPDGARLVAAAAGAPEPQVLLKRLGEISAASLGDNARAFGLSGRGALTLDTLFQHTWRIWRGEGALATPAPDTTPINGSIIAALARSNPSMATAAAGKPRISTSAPETLKVLLTYREPEGKVDEAALATTVGLLAEAFEHSLLRVSVTKAGVLDATATRRVIEDVVPRFDLAPGRLVAAKKAPAKSAAAVEVLVTP